MIMGCLFSVSGGHLQKYLYFMIWDFTFSIYHSMTHVGTASILILAKMPPRGYMMSDRAVFDVIQILADLMPLDELISIKFGVRLIDPSLLINRIWREYY